MRIASAGQYNTASLAAILALVFVTYLLWRNYRQRGKLVQGARIAPAVDAALARLFASKTRFVVLSVSRSVYLQSLVSPTVRCLPRPTVPRITRPLKEPCRPRGSARSRVLRTIGVVSPVPMWAGSLASRATTLTPLARDRSVSASVADPGFGEQCLAEGARFELAVALPPHGFSRAAP